MALAGYGGGTLGRNPFDWMELVRRTPQGAIATFWSSMRGLISLSAMALVLGQHIRVGNEDNIWGADRKRATSVKQIEGVVRLAKEFGRKVATAEEAHKIMKIGVWYDSVEETLKNLGLPPNPTEYNPGFLLWETDGKLKRAWSAATHPIASCLMPPPSLQAQSNQSLPGGYHMHQIPLTWRSGMKLKDKVALITGGAQGLAKRIAIAMANERANIVICDIKEEGLARTVKEIEQLGVQALGVRCDVSSPESVATMFERVTERFGTLHILVNNAARVPESPKDEERRICVYAYMSTPTPRQSLGIWTGLSDEDWS